MRDTRDYGKKKTHEEVQYSEGMPSRHCSICDNYLYKGPHCKKVVDPIDPDMWCIEFKRV